MNTPNTQFNRRHFDKSTDHQLAARGADYMSTPHSDLISRYKSIRRAVAGLLHGVANIQSDSDMTDADTVDMLMGRIHTLQSTLDQYGWDLYDLAHDVH